MKIIFQDLINLLDKNPSIEEVSSKLFQLGHEHEIDKDIFLMELTPNRGDCFSLQGLARDLNRFYGPLQEIQVYEKEIDELTFDFENSCENICPSISFLEIKISDNIDEYKPYLENYFKNFKLNKTNFFADVSNYLSYEIGQPTHCYDRKSIKSTLVLEELDCNSKFKTLLGNEISLNGKNYVFTLGNDIVNLAGVMGGLSTSCSPKTREALVECAFFEPESIIGKSQKYNLVSDAAFKFERGVDILSQERTLRRFIKIVSDHTDILSLKYKSYEKKEFTSKSLEIDVAKINSVLGTNLSKSKYLDLLQSIGFQIGSKIMVPSFRHDIKSQNDLAEEVARLIGYNNIPSKPINVYRKRKCDENNKANFLRDYLISNGFNEIINFPFTNAQQEDSLKIDNPLDSNKQNLRTTLRNSLIENLLYNERRQKDSIKLFEISNVYERVKNKSLPNEIKKIGIIVSGRVAHNYLDFSKKIDKKFLEKILNNISEKNLDIEEILRSTLDTKYKSKIFYTEINLRDIFNKSENNNLSGVERFNFTKYIDISDFPSSVRDFSFLISDLSKYEIFMNLINNINDKNIKDSFIFDFYKNEDLNQIKIGVRIIFQSNKKTLSEEEIYKSAENVIKPIIMIEGVSIPGLEYNI